MSEVRRSDLQGEQERTGRVSEGGGTAVAADGAGGAAGKSDAASKTSRWQRENNNKLQ